MNEASVQLMILCTRIEIVEVLALVTCLLSLETEGAFHLKGRFSSGLQGASAIKLFSDLTGKQPRESMYNNHNQLEIIMFKMAKV